MKILLCAIFLPSFLSANLFAQDWSSEATLPGEQNCFDFHGHRVCLSDQNRNNILNLTQTQKEAFLKEGSKHTSDYPVEITPLLIPYRPLKTFFEAEESSLLKKFVLKIVKGLSGIKSLDSVYKWLGLHTIPDHQNPISPNRLPLEVKNEDITRFGVTLIEKNHDQGLTMSCAVCHSSNLFGVKVLGMANRFPQANHFFVLGKKALGATSPYMFEHLFGASEGETQMFIESKKAIKFVETKNPQVLGLDTSLAQVGLSLARRAPDEYATRALENARHPRKNKLEKIPADSKPAVWWNLKYKTRWLLDGSVVSGNPIYTNILWNEIGRGADLKELEEWFANNQQTIDELTSYVFAAKAPLFNDFFPNQIDIELAKKGEKLFLNNCSGCHGIYQKGWSQEDHQSLSYQDNIKTIKVLYHTQTPVIDVGTDPLRYQGMQYFAEDLNRLKISQMTGTVVEPQKGYVPPPLVGIWARFPYFHNNSVPTLYDVLTVEEKRPKTYRMTETLYPETDFDFIKNGYPKASKLRAPFKSQKKYLYNTRKKGLSNQGHTQGILVDERGKEKFTHQNRLELIEFLKTL